MEVVKLTSSRINYFENSSLVCIKEIPSGLKKFLKETLQVLLYRPNDYNILYYFYSKSKEMSVELSIKEFLRDLYSEHLFFHPLSLS